MTATLTATPNEEGGVDYDYKGTDVEMSTMISAARRALRAVIGELTSEHLRDSMAKPIVVRCVDGGPGVDEGGRYESYSIEFDGEDGTTMVDACVHVVLFAMSVDDES